MGKAKKRDVVSKEYASIWTFANGKIDKRSTAFLPLLVQDSNGICFD